MKIKDVIGQLIINDEEFRDEIVEYICEERAFEESKVLKEVRRLGYTAIKNDGAKCACCDYIFSDFVGMMPCYESIKGCKLMYIAGECDWSECDKCQGEIFSEDINKKMEISLKDDDRIQRKKLDWVEEKK